MTLIYCGQSGIIQLQVISKESTITASAGQQGLAKRQRTQSMGMDVYGRAPKSEKGEYFRNNVWWWHPLADFICANYGDIARHCAEWHTNSGDGLDAEQTEQLVRAIKADIASGMVAEFARRYDEHIANLPRQDCGWCDATGIRTDSVGFELGMHDKELPDEIKSIVGRSYGWCNGCEGIGTTESFEASYPFDVENVQEFVEFLEHSGGFRIH